MAPVDATSKSGEAEALGEGSGKNEETTKTLTRSEEPTTIIPVAGLLIFAVLGAYFMGRLGGSVLWVPLLLYIVYWISQRRLARFNLYHAHKIERQQERQKLDQHVETVEWLNIMLEQLWAALEQALSAQLEEKINDTLQKHCPGFLDSLELTEFTFGSSPPAIITAKVHPQSPSGIIHLDVELCFVPNEIEESATNKGMLSFGRGHSSSSVGKWNSKMILTARIGKGILRVDVPVMLKELRVQVELAPTKPFLKQIQLSFLQQPTIDFILKPLKSFDLMDLPGLSNWLFNTINENIAKTMVNPNMITIPIAAHSAGQLDVRSIGVLKVFLFQLRGIKLTGAMSELFVRLEITGKTMQSSKHIDPETGEWGQVFFLLVGSLKSPLTLCIMANPSLMVGSVTFPILDIESERGASTKIWRSIVHHESSKIRGELNFGVEYYPAIKVQDPEADVDCESGIAQISIHQLKDMTEEEGDKKHLNCFFEIFVHPLERPIDPKAHPPPSNDPTHYRSKPKKKTASPGWEDIFEVFIAHKAHTGITVLVRHAQKEEILLGMWSSSFAQLVNRTDWFRFDGASRAQFYGSFLFQPVRIDLEGAQLVKATPCIGLVRLRILAASGFKGGKGPFHVVVTLNGRLVGKTRASISETSPVWNKTFTMIIKDRTDKISLDIIHTEKGASCGQLVCPISELLEHAGYDIERNDPLREDEEREAARKVRYTAGIYLVRRDDDLAHAEDEIFDVIEAEPSPTATNCGILEVHSIAIRDIAPITIQSLHLVEISWNEQSPVYKTPPARIDAQGGQEWDKLVELLVRDPDDLKLTLTVRDVRGCVEESLGMVSIPLEAAKSNQWYQLSEATQGQVRFTCRYEPLPLLLEPEVEESGTLYVELLDACELIAVDAGGTSDPFCVLRLNGEKFFKSKVKKKCLTPVFKESCEVAIKQKDLSTLQIELRDWNKVSFSRTLGLVNVDLQNLSANQWEELDLSLENVSSGRIHLRLKFVPLRTTPQKHHNVIAVPSKGSDSASKAKAENAQHKEDEKKPLINNVTFTIPENEPIATDTRSSTIPSSASSGTISSSEGAAKSLISHRSSLRLSIPNVETAAGLKFTIVELTVSGDEAVAPFDCKIKVRKGHETIYKTRLIKESTCPRWNETFTIDPEALRTSKKLALIPKWTRKLSEAEGILETGELNFETEESDQTVSIPLRTADGQTVGQLLLRYTLTMDTQNLVDIGHPARSRFSFLAARKK